MKFGDKLREQRKKAGLTQGELALEIGVTMRTLANYENGSRHPQNRSVYYKLADFFEVDVNYFLTEDEEFLALAAEGYGTKGLNQAKLILAQTAALFAGGELSEEDQKSFQLEMQALFFESKDLARAKFAPQKLVSNRGS
jgi:transcriptional regulator with XRE-family HTH domain